MERETAFEEDLQNLIRGPHMDVTDANNGALTLFEDGMALASVARDHLVSWQRHANTLILRVRRSGATKVILETIRVPMMPGNEQALSVLASWAPEGDSDALMASQLAAPSGCHMPDGAYQEAP